MMLISPESFNFFLFLKFWTERKLFLIKIHSKDNLLRFIARELELEEMNGVRKKTEEYFVSGTT